MGFGQVIELFCRHYFLFTFTSTRCITGIQRQRTRAVSKEAEDQLLPQLARSRACHLNSLGDWLFFFFFYIFIGVKLLYNGVLLSALQQSESAIHIHISPYLFPLASPSLPHSLCHPSRWSQSTKLISLCHAAASH